MGVAYQFHGPVFETVTEAVRYQKLFRIVDRLLLYVERVKRRRSVPQESERVVAVAAGGIHVQPAGGEPSTLAEPLPEPLPESPAGEEGGCARLRLLRVGAVGVRALTDAGFLCL